MWKLENFDLCSECFDKLDPKIRLTGKPYRVDAKFICSGYYDSCESDLSFWEANEGACCQDGLAEQQFLICPGTLDEESKNIHDRDIPSELQELKRIEDEKKYLQYENELAKLKYESSQERLAVHEKKEELFRDRLSEILIDAGKSLTTKRKSK